MVARTTRSVELCAMMLAIKRSRWNCCIWRIKPIPSGPMRLHCGTRTLSKTSSAVSLERLPSFFNLRPTLKPGVSVGTVIQVGAAVLFRISQAQKAQVAHLLKKIVGGEDARLLPLVYMGGNFPLDKGANGLTEHFVFFGEVHGAVVHGTLLLPAVVHRLL